MEHVALIRDAATLETTQGMPTVMNHTWVTHLLRLAFYPDMRSLRYIITETLRLSTLLLFRMLVLVSHSRASLRCRTLFLFVSIHILRFVIQW